MNLWSNALKYTEKGIIIFSVKNVNSNVIKVSIRDTGIGCIYFIFN